MKKEDRKFIRGLLASASLNDLMLIKSEVDLRSRELGLLGDDE